MPLPEKPRPPRATSPARLALLSVLSLTAAVAAATPAPEARGEGGIAGVVSAQLTLRPVEDAVVFVEGTSLSARSDAEGRFRIEAVPAGEYQLRVERDGYVPAILSDVVVTPNRETPAQAQLRLIRFATEVAVVAAALERPKDVATGAFLMSQEEVRRAPGALADVSRMIQALPGIAARDDQRNDIAARGGSPAETLTLVDGIEAPNLNHFGGQGSSGGPITMLNAETVADASFLAGGFPAGYDNRLSAVLDVSLREGNRERFEAEFDLGMAGAGLLAEGPLGSRGSWLLTARRSYLDLIAGAYGLDAIPQYASYQAKLVYRVAPRHTLSLVSLGGWDEIDFRRDPNDPSQPDTIDASSSGWRTVSGLSLRSLLGGSGVATVSLAHSANHFSVDAWDETLDFQLVERNRSQEDQITARADLTLSPASGSWLRAGAAAKRLDGRIEIQMPHGTENYFSPDATRINAVALDQTVEDWQYAGYLQLAQDLGPRLTASGGLRYDRLALNRAEVFSPRAGLTLRLLRGLELSASWGRYAQNPALVFMRAHPGNASLAPIRAEHFVAGFAFSPRSDWRLSAEAFHKRYRDYPLSTQFPFLTMADTGEQYDVSTLLLPLAGGGRGRSSGVEAFLQKRLTGRAWGQLSYSYSQTEHRALDGVWRPGSYDLPHVLSVLGGLKATRSLELSAKFSYTSGRPLTPLDPGSALQNRMIFDAERYNAERGPAYHRLDLRADHRSSHRWGNVVTYLELDNAYDRENVRFYVWNPHTRERQALPQLSLMMLGGVNLEF